MVQHGSAIIIIGERVRLVYDHENNFFSHLLIFFASTYILCTAPTNHRELALRERKDGCFCTFNDFNIFAQLSFPSLPQISSFSSFFFFPAMPLQNSHFSHVLAFRQGKPPLNFVANYVLLFAVQDAQRKTKKSS